MGGKSETKPETKARQHNLVDDTLVRADDGIVAICTCGWRSRGYFSSMSATLTFRDHQENACDE